MYASASLSVTFQSDFTLTSAPSITASNLVFNKSVKLFCVNPPSPTV